MVNDAIARCRDYFICKSFLCHKSNMFCFSTSSNFFFSLLMQADGKLTALKCAIQIRNLLLHGS
jgi:hypothetical protein